MHASSEKAKHEHNSNYHYYRKVACFKILLFLLFCYCSSVQAMLQVIV
jgi:hypothetical protein